MSIDVYSYRVYSNRKYFQIFYSFRFETQKINLNLFASNAYLEVVLQYTQTSVCGNFAPKCGCTCQCVRRRDLSPNKTKIAILKCFHDYRIRFEIIFQYLHYFSSAQMNLLMRMRYFFFYLFFILSRVK